MAILQTIGKDRGILGFTTHDDRIVIVVVISKA
jgi:hypothetical protein